MTSRLHKYWDLLRGSFWFLPSIMTGAAIALALSAVALDRAVTGHGTPAWSWAYTGGAEGASLVLGTIAGSMITLAGLVFSMTLVTLSLAAANFGPRLLQNFMRDTANQVVLGTFVATFLYCLLVLRTIRHADAEFVPHLSVTLGVLLALVSIGILIYFIHHVAVSIQADEIITRVGRELDGKMESLFPEQIGAGASALETDARALAGIPAGFEKEADTVAAPADGYLQLIEADALMNLATRDDLLLRVVHRPGDFIRAGSPLVLASPAGRLTRQSRAELKAAFMLGSRRTAVQDIRYVVGQLVEVAVRALSPGINDPFTAISCIDRLGAALGRLAQREIPGSHRRDETGRLRVIASPTPFSEVADTAFDSIRRYGRGSAEVSLHLLKTIAAIAGSVRRDGDRAALHRHATLIARDARAALPNRADRRAVGHCFDAARQALRVTSD